MEDVFNTMDHIAKTKDRKKIYSEPNFKLVLQVAKEWVQVSTWSKTQPIKPIMAPVPGHSIVLVS